MLKFDLTKTDIDEVEDKISDRMIDTEIDVTIDNDGIGPYECHGYCGVDKGTDYAYIEEQEEVPVEIIFDPKEYDVDDIDVIIDAQNRDWEHGGDDYRDGIPIETHLAIKDKKIIQKRRFFFKKICVYSGTLYWKEF